MRVTLRQAVGVVAGLLVAAALAPAARAQGFAPVPTLTAIRLQTTVTVPDGGTVTLGGYSRLSEGRTEFGLPGGRGLRNIGYGRSAVGGRVNVRVRIINLREEEYRQTGYRSR
jgi:general secretion pathway protein D